MKIVLVPLLHSFHVEAIPEYISALCMDDEFMLSVLLNDTPETKIIHDKFKQVIPAEDFVPFMVTKDISSKAMVDEPNRGFHALLNYCNEKKIRLKASIATGNDWHNALVKNSAYADLVIIPYDKEFSQPEGNPEKLHFSTVLHQLKCPVLLIPPTFKKPESIILSYDHSDSSVIAIRQFYNLFPKFCRSSQSFLITVGEDLKYAPNLEDPLDELLIAKLENYSYKHLEGSVVETLETYFKTFKAPIMTLGSFGRSKLSEFFMPAIGEALIKKDLLPLFIAH